MWKLNKLKNAVEDKQCNAYAKEFKTTPMKLLLKKQPTIAEIADRLVRNVNKYATNKKQLTFVYKTTLTNNMFAKHTKTITFIISTRNNNYIFRCVV